MDKAKKTGDASAKTVITPFGAAGTVDADGAFIPPKSNFGSSKQERAPKEDPLTAALAIAQAKVDEQKIKLKAILADGEKVSDLRAEAAATIEGNRKAGQYNKTVKGANNKEVVQTPAADDPRITQLKNDGAENALLAEQIKAVAFANERSASVEDDSVAVYDRLTDSLTKQSDAYRALSKEMARAGSRAGAGAVSEEMKQRILGAQALNDLGNAAADGKQKAKPDTDGLSHNEKISADLAASHETENTNRQNQLDEGKAQATRLLLDTQTAAVKLALDTQLGLNIAEDTAELFAKEDAYKKAEVFYQAGLDFQLQRTKEQAKELKKALETPMDGLAKQWNDTQQQLQGLQDQWANGFVALLETTMHKGESRLKQFRDNVLGYMKSVLTGIMDVAIKKSMGDSLKTVIDSATAGLQSEFASLFGSSAGNGGVGLTGSNVPKTSTMTQAGDYGMNATASSASDAAGATSEASATTAVTTAMTTLSTSGIAPLVTGFESLTTTGITPLMEAAQECATALRQAATSAGGSGGGAGGIGGLFGGAGGATSSGATAAGASDMSIGADFAGTLFANGGIMTSAGPLELRKYATGGIANSPQVAVYGEAGPEAYVPLPDGRSIPVTISGSGDSSGSGTSAAASPPITVNVINQSGTQVAAQQQGPSSISAGQMILNVVLTAASQPGSFRSGMQTALTSPSSSSTKPA